MNTLLHFFRILCRILLVNCSKILPGIAHPQLLHNSQSLGRMRYNHGCHKHLLPMEQYGSDAIYFILLILGMAWGGDSAAYFTGRFLGKHKLAPVVSPHKTVEGAIGGVFGSMLLAVVITAIYEQIGGLYSLMFSGVGITWRTYLFIAVMGAIGSGLGILGDLFASVVKRQQGIKDYGKIFPGHGGILDRFDSVMFIAPFVTLAVTLLFYRVAQ